MTARRHWRSILASIIRLRLIAKKHVFVLCGTAILILVIGHWHVLTNSVPDLVFSAHKPELRAIETELVHGQFPFIIGVNVSENATESRRGQLIPHHQSSAKHVTPFSREMFGRKSSDENETISRERVEPSVNQSKHEETSNGVSARIAYIAFCHLKGTQRMENLIFASLETWHPRDQPYFIVFTKSTKPIWENLVVTNGNFTKYQRAIQPVFVDCPEGRFGESPCCKQEKGLLGVLDQYGSDFDWFLFQDDDVYMRHEYLQLYLTPLNPLEVKILAPNNVKPLGQTGYVMLPQQPAYHCERNDTHYKYPWGMPVVYSKAALLHISNGLRQGGLVKQCMEFNVTHDVGNAVFHWMYTLPFLWWWVPDRAHFFHNAFGAHAIGRITRGNNDTSMMAVHKGYMSPLLKQPDPSEFTYRTGIMTGFRRTRTYEDYGDPANWTQWHIFPVKDCSKSEDRRELYLQVNETLNKNDTKERLVVAHSNSSSG